MILNHQLNNDGILIFEQIKNKNDLINNLKKFNFNFKIYFLPPIRWQKFRFITKLSFTSFYFQLFLRLVYKIIGKKITQFILIKKFWFYEYKLAHNNEDIEVGKESEKKIEQYDKEEDNWEILISK